jgi:hypothetical protein
VADVSKRFHEIQVGFDWASTATTAFVVNGLALDVDLKEEESQFCES